MADNHVREDASAGEDGGFSALEIPNSAAAAESSTDSVDQMDPTGPSNRSASDSFHNEPNETMAAEDGVREDTFVDCPDEIENSESQQNSEEKDNLQDDQSNELDSGVKVQEVVAEIELLRDKLEKSVAEKERLEQEFEEERAVLMRELSHLCYQLKVSNDQHITADGNADGFIDRHQTKVATLDVQAIGSYTSLHEMISECSIFLKNAIGERLRTEEKVRELHSVLYLKDQEIDFLNAKVADLIESSNIAQSNSNLKHDSLSQSYEAQLEKDQHIEEIANRILASLTTVHQPEELLDGSLTERISNIEKSVTFLVEKYTLFLSESNQLKECLNGVALDFNRIDEIGTFVMARDKILELRRKEEDMYQNLSSLEDENKKLMEELEKQKSTVENANAEIGRLSAEVEQEKNRYANTKEKLTMAVTKGKALVQQRDSLKQSLLEKTSQLEKCSVELQEKSSALEAAEKTKELLVASEKLTAFLQESLAEKETILQKCGEILSENFAAEELEPTDITKKLRWLADENKSLKDISVQYHKLTDALLSFDFPETVASSELDVRVSWLAESFDVSKEESAKLQSERTETTEAANRGIEHLTTSLLAEIQEKSYLQAELEDISSKYEAHKRLQDELVEAREAGNNEIDRLTSSLLAESQERSNLQLEFENLRHKYEGVIEKENLASLEKDKIVSMLLEASGLAKDGQGEVHPENSDMTTIIDNCIAKIRAHACPREPSLVEMEIFESFKSLLYIRDQEMTLYKLMIEEDILDRAQVSHLSDELAMKNQQLNALKDEKVVMQKSLEQLEERCALLKEKLSMAVKKGKGLVQERENLKGSLNEKNTEIDSLKSKLQQYSSKYAECQDQISKLLLDAERIPLLETDLVSIKEHAERLETDLTEKNAEIDSLKSELQQYSSKYVECQDQISKLLLDVERIALLDTDLVSTKERVDQLEQFLAESNRMLQRVMESIEGIATPTNLFFNEPVEKVKWIAGYLSENEISKTQLEEELRNVEDEASSLASKLSEVQAMMKSLEDALSIAENSRSELLDERKELEVSKALLEEELQKEKDKASSHTSKFEELSASKRALEDALSRAEDNASRFINERDIAVESRSLAEEQIKKLNEELSNHVNRIADADKNIQSLEDALSQAQKNISLLADKNSKVEIGRADLHGEIKRIREESDAYASKLSEASITIKSLEDALVNAENNIADLVQGKKIAEQEIIALTSKLESCMEELSGTRSSIENRSLELSGQLSRLQILLKDETLSTLLGQCFQRKFESLKSIDFLLKEMWNCFPKMDSDVLQNRPVMEDGSSLSTTLPFNSDIAPNMELLNGEVNAVDSESITEKMVERFHLKDRALADKFDNLSTLMDESISTLLRRLHITKDKMVGAMKYMNSLKDQLKDIETDKKRQDDTIMSFESDIRILLSACTDATQGLKLNVQKNVSELRSIHELVDIDGRMFMDLGAVEDDAAAAHATDLAKKADMLFLATRQNQDLSKLFQDAVSKLMSMMEDMQKKLKETQLTYGEVLEERDQCRGKILKLETDLIAQQNLYHEMAVKLEQYKDREDELGRREAELSTSLSKAHDLEDILSASQVKSILDKINQVKVPGAALPLEDSHDSANVRKLCYVIDSFDKSLQKVSSLSHENEELQSTIDEQILEIEQLKRQVESYMDKEKHIENRNKLLELESSLQIIVRKLGGGDLMDDSKVDGPTWVLPLLDKLVTATVLESESLKLKNEELGAKLVGAQKAVDDLSNKVNLLEESNQARAVLPESDQERGTSISPLSTQSEISEMQDMAALGKSSNIPSSSSAAHVRTLRKGSSDQLAINIESESERFINNKESDDDDDKGHVFKSLVSSGLIPRQGRSVADRIDGIWVSGSRALMNHPRGRLGVVAYWLVLHIWLLGTIL